MSGECSTNSNESNSCCPSWQSLVSGSPIIQNGKLVGEMPHVLFNDSNKEYGKFMKITRCAAEFVKKIDVFSLRAVLEYGMIF